MACKQTEYEDLFP